MFPQWLQTLLSVKLLQVDDEAIGFKLSRKKQIEKMFTINSWCGMKWFRNEQILNYFDYILLRVSWKDEKLC